MQTMTIFTEAFATDEINLAAINAKTKCGKMSEIYLNPNTYFGAKETPWEDSLLIEPTNPECLTDEAIACTYDFATPFGELDTGNVPALIMDIPTFLKLKDYSEIVDEGEIVVDDSEQVTTFNETIENGFGE